MNSIGEVLTRTIEALPVRKLFREKQILWSWPAIMGKEIADQSAAVSIEFGVLYLAIQNSVWCHHLSMMKREIIQKVNAFVGEPLVRDVKFRSWNKALRKQPQPEEEAQDYALFSRLQDAALSAEEKAEAEASCAAVRDERLRGRLRRLYASHLALRRRKKEQGWTACAACGAACRKESEFCSCCLRERRQAKLSEIRRTLCEVPWSTYAEINRYIPCTSREYIDAKVSLLHRLSDQLPPEEEMSLEAKVLTMLFTGAKYDALSDALVQKTVEKFRRRAYVSTSR